MLANTIFAIFLGFVSIIFMGLLFLDLYGLMMRELGGEDARDSSYYKPKTLVIVPCKGIDIGLYQDLCSLKLQTYNNYDLVAVIDSTRDPAIKDIKKAGIKHMVSQVKCKNCSGKVKAISTALEKFKRYDVYVVADSDICVDRFWLYSLIKPLYKSDVCLSTMFPYFRPTAGFWSKVKFVWGFVGDGLLEKENTRFGWGGSMAFKRAIVKEALNLFKNSEYSISDDICITKAVKAKGLKIAYVKVHRPTVESNENFSRFSEWSNRQTALTLLGYRKNLHFGLLFYPSEITLFISGILLSLLVSPFFVIFLAHFAKCVILNYSRTRMIDPAVALITALMPFIYLANLLIAKDMGYIVWRGSRYMLPKA